MPAVAYRTTGIDEIELIRPLLEQLNEYHHTKISWFRTHYERMTFDERRLHFDNPHKSGQQRPDLAADTETGKYIGYLRLFGVSG